MQRLIRGLSCSLLFAIAGIISAQEAPSTPPPPPEIDQPGEILLSNDPGRCSASGLILGTPGARDFAGGHSLTVARDDELGITEPFPTGNTILTWTATDTAGQTTTVMQRVHVKDTELPAIEPPPDLEVDSNDDCFAADVNEGEPVVKHNCPGSTISIKERQSAGDSRFLLDEHPRYPIGTTTITWMVTDAEGHQATARQKIVVHDSGRPHLEALPDVETSTDPGRCTAFVEIPTPPDTGTCSRYLIVPVRSDGKRRVDMPFPAGRTTIVWTATNSAGQTATAEQTVVVNHMQGPVIELSGVTPQEIEAGNERMVGVRIRYHAADLCGGEVTTSLSVTSSEPDEDERAPDWEVLNDHFADLRAEVAGAANRIYTIHIKAVDAAGNESEKSATVTVKPAG
jgi:hypothetical protein